MTRRWPIRSLRHLLFGPRQSGVVTGLGAVVGAVGVVAYLAGWWFGWIELMVLAAGCAVALLMATPFVIGRSRLTVTRSLSPARVRAGDTALAELRAINTHRLPLRRTRVDEQIDDGRTGTRLYPVDVPRLPAGGEHLAVYALPTERRGVVQVGPAVVSRGDPMGLLRRQAAHSDTDTLWVHPRWRLVQPLSAGFAKDLEGPTSDQSPAGDIAFHTVRPYNAGDDPRHIHWMSSARMGEVMVRHYVDNRRPHLTVVVDPSPTSYEGDEFETAIAAAASMAVSAGRSGLPIAVRVGERWMSGRARPGDVEETLDRLTTVDMHVEGPLVLTVADALRVERSTSVVALITTARATAAALGAVTLARRHAKVIVVDVGAAGNRLALPSARTVAATDVDEFATAWNRLVTR
jgi:uncharacterized protein (DUF58 family)